MFVYMLCLMLGTSGCASTMRQVPFEASGTLAEQVAVGETVRILTKNGDEQTFKVTEMTMTTLKGEGVEIAFSDIEYIEKRTTGGPGRRTTAIVLTLAAVALIAVGLSDMSPGVSVGLSGK